MSGPQAAGATAARVVVPARAAAFEEDQEISRIGIVVHVEPVLRAIAAHGKGLILFILQLDLLPRVRIASVDDGLDVLRERHADRDCGDEQREAKNGPELRPGLHGAPALFRQVNVVRPGPAPRGRRWWRVITD